MNRFKKANTEDDHLFDPRQKGSDFDRYYGVHEQLKPPVEDQDEDNNILFDPRQKGSELDAEIARHEHILPMKYEKKPFKIRRVK